VSSLALMRFLESSPSRYDLGMRWLTLGRVERLHDAVAANALPSRVPQGRGPRVLEIGCGTGAVTARLVERGARVTALDQSPEMQGRARERIEAMGRAAADAVAWLERSASEIDALPAGSFDVVVASLCLSEMSTGERGFVLRAAVQCLAPDGRAVIADEVRPRTGGGRALVALLRAPQATLGWLLAGSTSRPIASLRDEIEAAGLHVRHEQRWLMGTLALFAAGRMERGA